MARRATFFKTVRENGSAVFIGGGYELALPGTEGDRHPAAVEQLKRAYGMLGYDIFLLSPTDAAVLKGTKVQAPRAWQPPLDEPACRSGGNAFLCQPRKGFLLVFGSNYRQEDPGGDEMEGVKPQALPRPLRQG